MLLGTVLALLNPMNTLICNEIRTHSVSVKFKNNCVRSASGFEQQRHNSEPILSFYRKCEIKMCVHREKQFSIQIINQVWTKCINYRGHGARMAQKCERDWGVQPHGSSSITLVYIPERGDYFSLFNSVWGEIVSERGILRRPAANWFVCSAAEAGELFILFIYEEDEWNLCGFCVSSSSSSRECKRFIDVLPSAHACWSFLCAQHREILPDRPLCWQTCINFLLKKSATHNYCAVSLFLAFYSSLSLLDAPVEQLGISGQ